MLTRERFAGLPDAPTGAEAGMPILEFPAGIGPTAPAGRPGEVVLALERAVRRRLGTAAMGERMRAVGLFPERSTRAVFVAALPRQAERRGAAAPG